MWMSSVEVVTGISLGLSVLAVGISFISLAESKKRSAIDEEISRERDLNEQYLPFQGAYEKEFAMAKEHTWKISSFVNITHDNIRDLFSTFGAKNTEYSMDIGLRYHHLCETALASIDRTQAPEDILSSIQYLKNVSSQSKLKTETEINIVSLSETLADVDMELFCSLYLNGTKRVFTLLEEYKELFRAPLSLLEGKLLEKEGYSDRFKGIGKPYALYGQLLTFFRLSLLIQHVCPVRTPEDVKRLASSDRATIVGEIVYVGTALLLLGCLASNVEKASISERCGDKR